MKKVPICDNHLGEFYEAIKKGDIQLMAKLEHELNDNEKCVACTYVYKTDGTVKEALESILRSDGLNIEIVHNNNIYDEVVFWSVRLLVFSATLTASLFGAALIKQIIFSKRTFSLFVFSIPEYVLIAMVALLAFVYIDDNFLE